MTKPPSRNAGYQGVTRDLVARDGQVCFLCGHKHATVHTLQADAKNRDKPFDLDNLIVACKPCAKRRNGKPIGAYWNERLSAAATEIAHINSVALNKEVIMSLREAYAPRITTPNAVGITGSTDEPKPEFDEDLAHLSRDQQREARAAPDYVPPSARPGYAPRITTPNAVDGTGSTMTEDQAKKLSEMIAAMNDDDDDDDDDA